MGRLTLQWANKSQALIAAEEGKYDYQWVDPQDPRVVEVRLLEEVSRVGDASGNPADNLLIRGDSIQALNALARIPEYAAAYRGKVKLVYIDPPFNTGQTFDHYADGLDHSIWLTMMRDRLRALRPLLARDASVWVHLDDAEVHRMRSLLDEEFGIDNFVGAVAWQKADSTRNDASGRMSSAYDTILVYRCSSEWTPNRLPRNGEDNARFSSPDGDPNPWWDDNPTAAGGQERGIVCAVQHPITGGLVYPGHGRHWSLGQEQMLTIMNAWAPYELRDIGDDEERAARSGVTIAEVKPDVKAIMLAVPVEEASAIAKARYEAGNWPLIVLRGVGGEGGGFGRKTYIPQGGRAVSTWWPNTEVGHNREAKAELKALFRGTIPFSTPKPERLMQRVIQIGTSPGDIVLDFFAGSGTTAAVAHKMGRRWVTVELLPATVDRFTRPRLQKVVAGEDPGGVTFTTTAEAVADLPAGVSSEKAREFTALLAKFAKSLDAPNADLGNDSGKGAAKGANDDDLTDLEDESSLEELELADPALAAAFTRLKGAARTRTVKTKTWNGGGGFRELRVMPAIVEVANLEDLDVLSIADGVDDEALARSVAAQLGFAESPQDTAPFAGRKGRSRLAVIRGVADEAVVESLLGQLAEGESLTLAATMAVPGVETVLRGWSKGSRLLRIPADLFPKGKVTR